MKKYDLEERTLKLAKACLDLCKLLLKGVINLELIKQIIRSSGSIGANYREASNSYTKKDFFHKIGICAREAKETVYWLEIMLHANPDSQGKIAPLVDESKQLALIFSSIANKGK